MPHPDRHKVHRWEVLIAGAGQMGEGNLFGRSIIADARLAGGFLGPDTFAIGFEEPGSDLNLWVYAVLNSALGRQGIRASAYGTSIPHLRADLLGELPIPKAPKQLSDRIAGLIRKAVTHRERYSREIVRARSVIESLPDVQAAEELCAERKMRSTLWKGPLPSLCAWTFASTGGALQHLLKKWSGRLADVVEPGGVFRGGRGTRVPCLPPHGIDFLSQRDAFLMRATPQRVIVPSTDLMVRGGTIMVGGQGTLGEGEIFGRATIVSEEGAKSAWTEHLLRIVPKPGEESRLYAFLTTTVGFRLLRSAAVGTKLLSLRPDLVFNLPIPTLSAHDSAVIDHCVGEAVAARSAADVAESEAIRIVDHEVIPQWLE
jgi:type I restriction enzyme S subunit